MPDLVIRDTRERADCSYLLAEISTVNGKTLIVHRENPAKGEDKLWRFAGMEGAVAWSALRAREIAAEGGEVSVSPQHEIAERFPDSRTLAPLTDYNERALKNMLQW